MHNVSLSASNWMQDYQPACVRNVEFHENEMDE